MPIFLATLRSDTPSSPFSSKSLRAALKMRSRVSTYTVYTEMEASKQDPFSSSEFRSGEELDWRVEIEAPLREGWVKAIRETDHARTGRRKDRAYHRRCAGFGRGRGADAGTRRRACCDHRHQFRRRETS